MKPKDGSFICIAMSESSYTQRCRVIQSFDKDGQYWIKVYGEPNDTEYVINMDYVRWWYYTKERDENLAVERAKKLCELKQEQLKLEKESVKDSLTSKELKPQKDYYEMPSFKKHP